jgi:hypothetical protein
VGGLTLSPVLSFRRWLRESEWWAARTKEEKEGVRPHHRGWAGLTLALIVVPLVLTFLVPWANDMAGIQGFLLGLLVAWGIWRLVEQVAMDERFRRAGGIPDD